MMKGYTGATAVRWGKFRRSAPMRMLEKLANKGGGHASLVVGARLEAVLKQLPSSGPLFPRLRLLSEDERASHFRKV